MMNTVDNFVRPPQQRADYGFFGPGSVVWRVWLHPSSVLAFQRAVSIETLDPFLAAAVVNTGGVYRHPQRRFERTVRYFLTSVLGDGVSAVRASDTLMKVHAPATGIEPMSGKPYSANDPDTQLWILLTAWHSILMCYERFGSGPLSDEDDAEYWRGCAVAAHLQTCDPAKVPTSRAGVREYFAEVRPRLALNEEGRKLFHYLFRPSVRSDARLLSATFHANSYAVVTTLPQWVRELVGVEQSRIIDIAAVATTRAAMIAAMPVTARLAAMDRFAPSARPIIEAVLRDQEPERRATVTFAEARAQVDAEREALGHS